MDEELRRELDLLFDYNPPPLVPDSKSPSLCPILGPPTSFYHKHLDDRLTLKRIVLMPSLTTRLSETVNRTLHSIEQQKICLPSNDALQYFPTQESLAGSPFEDPIIDADGVARAYRSSTSVHCMTVASMLFLSPRALQWDSALNWTRGLASGLERYRALEENYALKLLHIPGTSSYSALTIPNHVWDSMDNGIRECLPQVTQRFPTLAVWQIFAISREAEHFLNDIDRVVSLEIFRHDKCLTAWQNVAPNGDLPYAPDATSTSWGVSVATLSENSITSTSSVSIPSPEVEGSVLSRNCSLPRARITGLKPSEFGEVAGNSVKTRRKSISHSTNDETWSNVTVVGQSSSTATCLTTLLLQHAWCRSVLKDSTFIIFHCGNFERLGFRHRASQTLFLSELIDVPNCKDPGYGKLHIGLYISILHDVMERTLQQCSYEEEQNRVQSKKRRRVQASSGTPAKRPKTRACVAQERTDEINRQKTFNLVSKEALTRDVVLVQLLYGSYNSPAPASFLRAGKPHSTISQTYTPDQYFSLVVGLEIASGATGVVHNASLELMASGGVERLKVVVKFALKSEQQARLRHEFSIYEHLTSSEVKGIPSVFGLFSDTESDTLALVMTHVGICLLDRKPKGVLKITVPDPQRAAFIRVFEDIHRAGVRHHDPRVENLMIQDDGQVAVIDFDKAELDASERSKAREIEYLKDILDGEYRSRDGWPTAQTHQTSDSSGSVGGSSQSESGSETE